MITAAIFNLRVNIAVLFSERKKQARQEDAVK